MSVSHAPEPLSAILTAFSGSQAPSALRSPTSIGPLCPGSCSGMPSTVIRKLTSPVCCCSVDTGDLEESSSDSTCNHDKVEQEYFKG